MNRIVEQISCNGCEACYAVCKKNAITMKQNFDGFYYPVIDENLCVKCGICGKVCPQQLDTSFRKIDYNDTLAYGGYDLNPETLKKSSSGGFFGVLANAILAEEGVVYGVVFSQDYRNAYYASSDDERIDRMRGSKYVTARKEKIYCDVQEQLGTSRKVLFVGLPCEVAALYAVLKKDFDNLLTCELICAGASSYNLLNAQLDWLENRYQSETAEFSFRFKKYGWVPYSIFWKSKNRIKLSKMFDDTIFGIGMKYAKREACFNCNFKGLNRTADFSIGDFWNIDKKAVYYNESGTSVVFARTKKAESYMNTLNTFSCVKVDSEMACGGNRQQLQYASGVPERREEYLRTLRECGGEKAFIQFRPHQSIKVQVKNRLPVWVYKLLRRVEAKIH
ncbi:MAG: Coenzyme F420 hydrogenase/dehydrogenase, beta subunit C-terminal domain [Hespellia sp.]|nr:Coenzyme F420 hydrogenase/dehydrogenase, beta subunit C-terminal domain [Hespellia sp.]